MSSLISPRDGTFSWTRLTDARPHAAANQGGVVALVDIDEKEAPPLPGSSTR